VQDVYVIDAEAAIELARRGHTKTSGDYELFAPTLLRSQVLSILHTELVAEDGDPKKMLELAEAACRLARRLLGDAVLRATAWRIATEHQWSNTLESEYIALTLLHGKALIANDDELRASASGIVPTDTVGSFLSRVEPRGRTS
jgi:predicted nucleic acid-binding protein